jgi:hypothetical protein
VLPDTLVFLWFIDDSPHLNALPDQQESHMKQRFTASIWREDD